MPSTKWQADTVSNSLVNTMERLAAKQTNIFLKSSRLKQSLKAKWLFDACSSGGWKFLTSLQSRHLHLCMWTKKLLSTERHCDHFLSSSSFRHEYNDWKPRSAVWPKHARASVSSSVYSTLCDDLYPSSPPPPPHSRRLRRPFVWSLHLVEEKHAPTMFYFTARNLTQDEGGKKKEEKKREEDICNVLNVSQLLTRCHRCLDVCKASFCSSPTC